MSSPPAQTWSPPMVDFGDGSAQARIHGGAFEGSYPQIFFVPPKILLCSEKFVLNVWQKQQYFSPKNVFFSPKP